MTRSRIMRAMIAFVLAAIAMPLALPEGRAQTQDPILPPLSVARAKYLKDHPDEWKQLLSQLARQRAAPPQATPQPASPPAGGSWTPVPAAPIGLSNPLLLTDGTVIAHGSYSQTWYKLTPDINGSYTSGDATWTQISSMQNGYGPIYFASAVLPDGRVIVEGGEYNETCTGNPIPPIWTSLGAIYDPVANVWTPVSPPSAAGWTNAGVCGTHSPNGGIGDAASTVLPNGVFMLGACCANPPVEALFNATTLTYSATGAPPRYQDEQGYTLLQTGNVLTIDVSDPNATHLYNQGTGAWTAGASTPVSLVDPCGYGEIGPAVTRPDGTVVAFGGNTGCNSPADPTAIYNSSNGTWAQGPNIPSACGVQGLTACTLADAPAALLPNGNILFAASTGGGWTTPGFPPVTHFFEFTSANGINQVADPPNTANNPSFVYYFLVLPNGQVLMTDFSNVAQVYTPVAGFNAAWAPIISGAPSCVNQDNTYTLSGTQLSGLSQGAAYGDDVQGATNFPLVKIVNSSTSHVFYARTTYFNRSIAPGQAGSTSFQVAAATETGPSTLHVVTNGISSAGKALNVQSSVCPPHPLTDTHDYNGDGMSDIAWRNTNGDVAIWLMNGTQTLSASDIGNVPTSWSIVGQRQLNNSGNADFIWRNTNGDVAIWLMNGTQVISGPDIGNVPTNWTIVGTGAYNATKGYAELFWRDTAGDVAIWQMNGTQLLSGPGLGNVPTNWTIVGTGDFNGDGNTDILWRDTAGDVAIWFMNGTQVVSAPGLGNVPTSWTIVGTGDFNGDGKTDILWRNANGDVAIWLMNGTQAIATPDLGNVPTNWSIAETGDFDGDGMSDILWRNTNGDVAIWFMNGTQLRFGPDFVTVPTSWTIQGANAD
jgi:hypothetical protein